ncbi:MAG TPA: SDR family NAD(P)-dependent oxidoreductase, partial [Candidatus Limnocylindria bacterium]
MSEEAPFRFAGKVAVVTGAARGVGREIVRAFVEAGAQVVAADRDSDGLTETCRPHGARVSAIVADISTTDG